MNKQYTIKDLAKKLDLHHTTVSRALRDHPDVNKNTRQKVLEAVKKYNYIPNSFAKSLRNAKSKTIVVMVPAIKSFFFSEVLGIISDLAFKDGYSVMIYQSSDENDIESRNLDAIMENRVAGLIASVADINKNKIKYLQLQKVGIPVVLFDRFFDDKEFSRVVINNYQGAFDATEYLIEKGYRDIAFYKGKEGNPVFDERYNGYLGALLKHKIKKNDTLIFKGGIKLGDGIQCIQKISRSHITIDAMLCVVDMVALGVLTAARDMEIRVPDDIALIGFDNEPAGRIIRPALTTVAQPVRKIGEATFSRLVSRINGVHEPEEEIILNMELIKRNSA